jgi:CheY-like chemotaxis protein/HPt (histidine-containing phosphotransfer) domain-containing protein
VPGIGPNRKLPNVLIIDDDMVSREVMATVLTMTGYLVETASDGDESLALLGARSFLPDVILMDAQMPGLSGAALIDQLRAHSTATIYAISGSHAPDALIRGADGFFLKPIRPETLQRILQTHAPEAAATPSTSPESLPVILDPKILAQFRDMMSESKVREIYEALVADLEKRRPQLETAIELGDRAAVRRIGHSIKGGCSMAGARDAARLGELIESGVDDLEYIRSLLPLLESATRNLRRMLDAKFSPQGNAPAIDTNQ